MPNHPNTPHTHNNNCCPNNNSHNCQGQNNCCLPRPDPVTRPQGPPPDPTQSLITTEPAPPLPPMDFPNFNQSVVGGFLPSGWLRYNGDIYTNPIVYSTSGDTNGNAPFIAFYNQLGNPKSVGMNTLADNDIALYYFLGVSINNLLEPIRLALGINSADSNPRVYDYVKNTYDKTYDITNDISSSTSTITGEIVKSNEKLEYDITNAKCDVIDGINNSTYEIKQLLCELENHLKRTDSLIAGQGFDIKFKLELMNRTLHEISEHTEKFEELQKLRKVLANLGLLIGNAHQ